MSVCGMCRIVTSEGLVLIFFMNIMRMEPKLLTNKVMKEFYLLTVEPWRPYEIVGYKVYFCNKVLIDNSRVV